MANERSDKVYESWLQSTQKFDYFFLGLIGAICAYSTQAYIPTRLGINPGTLEVVSIFIVIGSGIAGFKRIELTNIAIKLNHSILQVNETKGFYTQYTAGINSRTGETITPEISHRKISAATQILDMTRPQLNVTQKHALIAYNIRNTLFLVGFCLLIVARLWSAYI